MKKLIAIIISILIVSSLSITAFAVDVNTADTAGSGGPATVQSKAPARARVAGQCGSAAPAAMITARPGASPGGGRFITNRQASQNFWIYSTSCDGNISGDTCVSTRRFLTT